MGIYFRDELKRHQKQITELQKIIDETACAITKNQLKFCLEKLLESKAKLTSKIGNKSS